ncbi:transcriptional repressor [Puniceicoccales bacterium CK1056]|uniref:Ferric uptake regulation protein n=1 Tax=Oceanipulchritudo coccoides TaxID=2706888 RepID=A0A6B2LWZ5_9BACT|nr:transcriptional repressor [Oceanipulchritudo coccoides]NDV61048.1 transcriptional repressor [Oceanipulchritudo coccoides]
MEHPSPPIDQGAQCIESACETFKAYLAKKGLRVTSQRLAIFEAAFNQEDHFTAEELLEHARKIDLSVSRATIYRTLPILTESLLVREIDVGRDYKFYLACHGKSIDQAQVVDIENDKIYEIDAPFLEWYARSIAEKIGLEAVSQRLQVQARPMRKKEPSKKPE